MKNKPLKYRTNDLSFNFTWFLKTQRNLPCIIFFTMLLFYQGANANSLKQLFSLQNQELNFKIITHTVALPNKYGQPVSLVKGDFDGDGGMDIMLGYSKDSKGYLVLLKGKRLSQYPKWSELSLDQLTRDMNTLFSEAQQVATLGFSPKILISGDFDADGKTDIGVTELGATGLYYLPGKGNGSFENVVEMKLGTIINDLAIGEWDRPDGLVDLLIETESNGTMELNVLQSDAGAFVAKLKPLTNNSGLSLRQFLTLNLAQRKSKYIKTNSIPQEPINHSLGRDNVFKTPSVAKEGRESSLKWMPMKHNYLSFSDNKKSIDGLDRIAMRMSLDAIDDVVILEASPNSSLKIVLGVPVATIKVNDTGDSNTRDGLLTLREAILISEGSLLVADLDANEALQVVGVPASTQLDQIDFDIPGVGPHVINLLSEFPSMYDSVVIDGTSEPDFVDKPVINLDGSLDSTGGSGISALKISGGNSTVRGLVINNLQLGSIGGSGIVLTGQGDNIIEGNFIGIDSTGTVGMGNGGNGVQIVNSANNLIGGSAGVSVRNVISGMGFGAITIEGPSSTGNRVEGNYIGTDVTGTVVIGNDSNNIGIGDGASQNVIGGLMDGTENIISGNLTISFPNIVISRGGTGNPDPASNVFQGNYIGTDITGTIGLGNASVGVFMTGGANNNLIGGAAVGAGNVISSSGLDGIRLAGSAYSNFVQGNLIGSDVTGVEDLGNTGHGVFLQQLNFGSGGTIIGGSELGSGNIIAFNGGDGVFIDNGSGSKIQGNSIFSNGDLAIDLCENFNATTGACDDLISVTDNDVGDTDIGANDLLNYPFINKVVNNNTANTSIIEGNYNGLANLTIDLEFFSNTTCDISGYGEAKNLLGAQQINTDATGNANFSIIISTPDIRNSFVTATASDSSGNTSELSACIQALSEIVFKSNFEN